MWVAGQAAAPGPAWAAGPLCSAASRAPTWRTHAPLPCCRRPVLRGQLPAVALARRPRRPRAGADAVRRPGVPFLFYAAATCHQHFHSNLAFALPAASSAGPAPAPQGSPPPQLASLAALEASQPALAGRRRPSRVTPTPGGHQTCAPTGWGRPSSAPPAPSQAGIEPAPWHSSGAPAAAGRWSPKLPVPGSCVRARRGGVLPLHLTACAYGRAGGHWVEREQACIRCGNVGGSWKGGTAAVRVVKIGP